MLKLHLSEFPVSRCDHFKWLMSVVGTGSEFAPFRQRQKEGKISWGALWRPDERRAEIEDMKAGRGWPPRGWGRLECRGQIHLEPQQSFAAASLSPLSVINRALVIVEARNQAYTMERCILQLAASETCVASLFIYP